MKIEYEIQRKIESSKLALACVFCQQESTLLGHNTLTCKKPARNCSYCNTYGHISIVCKLKKSQSFFNKVFKHRKIVSKGQKTLLNLHWLKSATPNKMQNCNPDWVEATNWALLRLNKVGAKIVSIWIGLWQFLSHQRQDQDVQSNCNLPWHQSHLHGIH